MTATPAVKYDVSDGIGHLVFNRPAQLNAIDLEMARQFAAAVEQAGSDPTLKVVILAGTGRSFIAGGDLSLFRDAEDKPAAARSLIDLVHHAVEQLATASYIVVAGLHGPIAGAGVSIALAADLAIAADDTTLDLAYAKIGASPDCGATWTLPRLVGPRRAMELAVLSDTVSAYQALEFGMVNRIVPRAELNAEIGKLAMRIADGPAVAHSWIKSLIRRSAGNDLTTQLAAEREGFAACADTRDFATGLDAFFARRPPVFQGR
jgi:2-(1,2-epoxy-1,2-dihydrophenyl)acetyl-CoA isomerase